LVFFYLSNMEIAGFKIELISRFFILSNVLFFVISVIFILDSFKSKTALNIISIVLIANSIFNVVRFYKINNFSKNTIIEDYAINFLNQAPKINKTMLLISSDTRYNALKYSQDVLLVRPDVLVTHPHLFLFKWYQGKLRNHNVATDFNKTLANNSLEIEGDLIIPNLSNFEILTNLNLDSTDLYQVSITPIGKTISQGSGLFAKSAIENPKFRSSYEVIKSPINEYDVFRELLTEYSFYKATIGNVFLKNNQLDYAEENFKQALFLVPWDFPSQLKICEIQSRQNKDASECYLESDKLKNNYFKYINN
jgi:hypothetical protein